ncbi:MAG TPA: glutamyl-tRNA reductase [Puia sp.]|nr:glutamyl-tRNA reductase [Puia sp.]
MGNKPADISKFFIAGINYKKTDAEVRGQFAINHEQYQNILSIAPDYGVNELFVISTCNRTEIYGFAENIAHLIDLLCMQTKGSKNLFYELAYIKNGMDAIEHLFNVAAGLDSQILGDYEIVGQIKQAVKFSKEHNCIHAFTERLFNCVLQSSKAIKNQTELSGGTISVSFAAVRYIKENLTDPVRKKILLIGTGKIGRNTCKNLVDYIGTKNITLINRSEEKSFSLADELGLKTAAIENMQQEISASDIVIVATNADQPIIRKNDLVSSGKKLLIDLSIPNNIEPASKELEQIDLVNVDDLSKINDATLQKREAEVPKAKSIINEHINEFMEWHHMRRNVPVLKAVKTKLSQIHSSPLFAASAGLVASNIDAEERIQHIINGMALKMRHQNTQGCHYIEAINDFITSSIN